MTLVNINLQNAGYETGPDDRVVFYSPANRNEQGTIISTAEKTVELVDGQATVELAHGPVVVKILAQGVADTREKSGYVPESGPVSLWDIIMDWSPALVDQGILAILAATEEALGQVEGAVAAEVDAIKWVKRNLTGDDDLRLLKSGIYGLIDSRLAAGLGLPTITPGILEVTPVNTSDTSRRVLIWKGVQEMNNSVPVSIWSCNRVDANTLTEWTRVDNERPLYRGEMTSGTNPDDYLTLESVGQWYANRPEHIEDTPFLQYGPLEVLAIGPHILQRYTEFSRYHVWLRWATPGSAIGTWTRVDAKSVPVPDTDTGVDYHRGVIDPGESVDDYYLPEDVGQWRVASGVTGVPTSGSLGVLECLAMLNSSVQRYTAYPSGDTYVRTFEGATPKPWVKVNADTARPPTPSGSGFKRIPLAVTLGLGSTTAAPLSQEVRYCIHFNAPITRWRLHIAAREARRNEVVDGTVDFQQWVLGGEGAGGAYIDPQTVLPAFSMDGQGFVSGWVNTPIPSGEPLLLGTSYVAQNAPWIQVGACWRGATSDSLSRQVRAPFEVWIEAETYATTPAIAVLGSSSDAGVGGSRPVVDSTISKYARANGALPVHYAASGDSMQISTSANAYKWNRWQNCDRPDAVLWALGSNDAYGASSLAEIQGYHKKVAEIVRDKVSDVIYGATVFQRASGDDPEREPYNAWLKTLPNGLRDVFDFSAAIGSPPDPDFDADGVHINDLGQDAILRSIVRPLCPPARSPRHLAYTGTGTPLLSDFPDAQIGDYIVRKSDGQEWRVDE